MLDTKNRVPITHSRKSLQAHMNFFSKKSKKIRKYIASQYFFINMFYNYHPPHRLNYHTHEHSQHATIIVTYNTKISQHCKNKPIIQKVNDIIDWEMYMLFNQLDPTCFIHALYIRGHKNNSTMSKGKHIKNSNKTCQTWQSQILQKNCTSQCFWIMVVQASSCQRATMRVSKLCTNVRKYNLLNIWSSIQASNIKVHFWIVILLCAQHVAIQVQLLVCDMKVRAGILIRKIHL